MTPEQAIVGVKRLQASYPQMTRLDEAAITAYVEEIGSLKPEDFAAGMKVLVRTSKFFPSIAEIIEATEDAARVRFQARDHEEREERLALQAGQDAIFDTKSSIHGTIQGQNHQRFCDLIDGKITLPEPEWVKRSRERNKGLKHI